MKYVYNEATDKLYGRDKFIEVSSEKMEEQIRELGDFQLKLDKLKTAAASPKVKTINYYTEDEMIESEISKMTEIIS